MSSTPTSDWTARSRHLARPRPRLLLPEGGAAAAPRPRGVGARHQWHPQVRMRDSLQTRGGHGAPEAWGLLHKIVIMLSRVNMYFFRLLLGLDIHGYFLVLISLINVSKLWPHHSFIWKEAKINPSDISFDQMTIMVGIPLHLSDDNWIGQNDNRQLRHLTGDYR